MKTFVLSSFICLLTIASLAAEPEIKGSPAELANYLATIPRIVAVRGEGEVKAQADRARVTLKVTTEYKSLADALRANEQVRGHLAAFLRDRGIGSERIRANKLSSTPKRGFFSEKARLQRVEDQIEVTIRDEKELQAVAAVPDKFPEATYVSAEFEHSDKEKLKAQAISEACDDADRHKRILEQKLGLKLTPRSFNEQSLGRPVAQDRPYVTGTYSATPLPGYAEPALEPIESISSFGELTFKVVLTVQYSAEPAQKP